MRLLNLAYATLFSTLLMSGPSATAQPILQRGLPQEGRGREEHHEGRLDRQPRPREGHGREAGPEAKPMRPMRTERFEPRQERPRDLDRGRDWPERSPDRSMERGRDRNSRPRERNSDERPARGNAEPPRRDYAFQPRPRAEARDWQRDRGWQRNGGWAPHGSWREHRVEDWQAAHRTWAQRGGYGGYYIPQTTFYAYYGPSHYFSFRPAIYMGYPRFWYGNYYFMIVDPWPAEWGDDWYAYDDCYIDFVDGGYYLCNRRYPGFSMAVTVML